MGVGIQRYANVAVTHDVLQCLGIHTGFGHIGAECVPAHMGRDLGHLYLVNAVVLVQGVLEVMLPMHCHHRAVILVKEQEARIAVNGRLDQGRLSVCQDSLETGVNIVFHRKRSCSCVGLGGFNVLCAITSPLKLMVNSDGLVLHIQVADSQSHKLRDSQPRVEQDIDSIVILAIILTNNINKITNTLLKELFTAKSSI